jgi:shikimate dehydrogenase
LDQYALMGNPVAHSLSPAIHQAFAKQTGQFLQYRAILVEQGQFPAMVRKFFDEGGKGLNVTVPFKEEAWTLARECFGDTEIAGAVNTLLLNARGELQGYNTDGIGLIRDIRQNLASSLHGKDVLILGAGGASRGILLPILRESPASLTIANRTIARAQALVSTFGDYGKISAIGLDQLEGCQPDWLINATSTSLPALPAGILRPEAVCYDLMYSKQLTPFCRWAVQSGAAFTVDGLGMLVEQAAEAFYIWHGIRPDTSLVIQELRETKATHGRSGESSSA